MLFTLFNRFRSQFSHQPFRNLIQMVVWCLVLFTLFVILFEWAEGKGWEEAFWQAWQTFTTVGFGNAPADTTAGRVITMVISTIGIAFLGALFSAAFDYKEYLKDQKRFGYMKNPFDNGYVIFNFPGVTTAENLIDELRQVEKNTGICFVDSRLENLPQSIASLPRVHFIKGDTLDRHTYDQARLEDNKAVLIFPIEPSAPESDAATKTVVDLVLRFTDKHNTRVIYTLVDQANAWMFEDQKAIGILADLEILAMVQEVQDPYSAEIIEKLLLNSKGANPETVTPIKIVGWTWGEFVTTSMKATQASGDKCNPFAIVQKSEPNTCPDLSLIIDKDDLISVIAYPDFDWTKHETDMVRAKG